MLQKNNRDLVLECFFKEPLLQNGGFQLRELSRKTKISPPSLKNYLLELKNDNLITIKKHRIHNYPTYHANRMNEEFKLLKKQNLINELFSSELINFLSENRLPKVIILFGSASKGEDLSQSDIDIYLECDEMELDLITFEEKLGRKINILFSKSFGNLSNELKNNLLNGTILSGYLKVF